MKRQRKELLLRRNTQVTKTPIYQSRELGETNWEDSSKDHYEYCEKSPQHDSRILEYEQEHTIRSPKRCR